MHDPADFDLERTAAPPPAPERRSPALWLILAAAALAAAAIWFFASGRQTPDSATESSSEQPAGETERRALGAAAEPIELPPLGETDVLVRTLVGGLTSHPTVAAWLTTDGLIRSFVVVVDNIATGATPAPHLRVLRPAGSFQVAESRGDMWIDPRSYERYTPVAAAVDSIDPEGAARLYSMLKPRIEEAHAELGGSVPFDRVLERAIIAMLQTPALDGQVLLAPQGAVYGYENAAMERMTAAQKHLARMGPQNVRVIQARLRQIALALGVPPHLLPS